MVIHIITEYLFWLKKYAAQPTMLRQLGFGYSTFEGKQLLMFHITVRAPTRTTAVVGPPKTASAYKYCKSETFS